MITEEQFTSLLARLEDATLDFKREKYNLSDERKKIDLIKDVICMANTPRKDNAYIVLGVNKHSDGSSELVGVSDHFDDADLQSQFSERVYPIPTLNYEVVSFQGKSFGVIVIPPVRTGPCVPIKDIDKNKLRQRNIYFRRGSKNDLATPEDVLRISRWISGSSESVVGPYAR